MSTPESINKKLPAWLPEKLPAFSNALYVPQRFADSTHDLWQLETESETLFLKVCSNTQSPFWEIMQHLFDYDLCAEIPYFEQLYDTIEQYTPLTIPFVLKAHSENHSSFILTSHLSGSVVTHIYPEMTTQLAHHLGGLHQLKSTEWGAISKPERSKSSTLPALKWPDKLAQTLTLFAAKLSLPEYLIQQALDACKKSNTHDFVALMPDLRWDQFLQQNQQLSALTDLDAFVFAPRELDFVLLEYLLNADQLTHFNITYNMTHTIPDISGVRPAYRLLLFLMEVLGEKDIHAWMNHETFFK